ncbi:MAG: exodeoxyribonuclease VII large subunit, partial [Casimicrobiaceae bacterium]
RIIIYPTPVQGDGAAASIALAIRTANERAEVDVLVVARGGGSIEDLWAFNEEAVAKAVFESALPVVSGVGHETDFTICDFVADARAPTPTGAAALVTPDRDAVLRNVAAMTGRWRQAQRRALEGTMQRVDGLSRRLTHPATRLEQQARDAALLAARLARAFRHRLDAASTGASAVAQRLARAARSRQERFDLRMAALAQNLAHLNPQGVLERGYAIVTAAGGAIVEDASKLAVGDDVDIAFARGNASATIKKN